LCISLRWRLGPFYDPPYKQVTPNGALNRLISILIAHAIFGGILGAFYTIK